MLQFSVHGSYIESFIITGLRSFVLLWLYADVGCFRRTKINTSILSSILLLLFLQLLRHSKVYVSIFALP